MEAGHNLGGLHGVRDEATDRYSTAHDRCEVPAGRPWRGAERDIHRETQANRRRF